MVDKAAFGLLWVLACVPAALAAQPAQRPTTGTAAQPGLQPRVGGQPAGLQDTPAAPTGTGPANADLRLQFRVRFVQQDTAYLDGGWAAGLTEGMKLEIRGKAPVSGDAAPERVAELVIVGVAQSSAVAEIHGATRAIVAGDLAVLTPKDVQGLVEQHTLGASRKFPAVISFTEGGDALDDEAHAEVPRPPQPSVNRARGRIGLDYLGTATLDASSVRSRDSGAMFQADFTQIGGTHWTLSGYWRGRLNATSSNLQPTFQDLINRTYHLSLTYDSPTSPLVAGFGRLYLPWATSLETLDGGYIGGRFADGLIAGVFGGSSPDPTSYNYNPNLERGGTFVNVQRGSFDSVRYSGTAGLGADLVKWQPTRPFVFLENSFSEGHAFSIYHAMQADAPSGTPATPAPGPGIGRSFLTVRWSPTAAVQLDANETYFRDVPTFDPQLVGTGLLDKYLFQGVSGGAHVEVVKSVTVYTELGRSSRTGDATNALNEMVGVTFARVPGVGLRVDGHYSRFSSAFGTGNYRALSFSRSFVNGSRVDVLAGDQMFASLSAGNQNARFLATTLDLPIGPALFVNGGFTLYRGAQQDYNQWLFTFGYRFDSRRRR